jgi:diguanylate cyclase (GGDEF)-like protein
LRHADGSWRTVEADVAQLAADGEDVLSVVYTARDVTNQRTMEDQLRRQAFEDGLTGLANRAVLYDRLGQAMARATRTGGEVAVLLLDLDSFKEINDGFGHPAGDSALQGVADVLVASVREGDTVARLGGDEFVVVAEARNGREVAQDLADRLHMVLPNAVNLDHMLDASIGVVVVTEPTSVDEVIRDADLAMYRAKTLGPGRTVFFERHMLQDAQTRLELGLDLNGALERGEFELHYQAINDLTTSRVIGAEALIRWHHPTRGLIAPAEFIPIAERNGAIVAIGDWVVLEACRQAAAWSESMPGRIESMHVNVSAQQLTGSAFVGVIAAALGSTGLDPHALVLELTESMLVDEGPAGAETRHTLKRLGLRIAIDDFGTGYSSLSRLAQLPIDIVKIDRSFVQAAGYGDGSEYRLLGSILTMTQGLRLESVAEGIERQEDLATMLDAGCRLGQGYLLGRPVPARDFEASVAGGPVLLTQQR